MRGLLIPSIPPVTRNFTGFIAADALVEGLFELILVPHYSFDFVEK